MLHQRASAGVAAELRSGHCAGPWQVLLAKARVEAEDAQRMLSGALNGLAALLLADGRPVDAVSLYRQVCPAPGAACRAACGRAPPRNHHAARGPDSGSESSEASYLAHASLCGCPCMPHFSTNS